MSSLLPPNATKLEKNAEKLGEKISSLAVPFIDLHRIDSCPSAHLPWLAWQHRVEYWQPDWSEPEKRNAISESESFNAQRGTRSSITSLLSTVVANFQLKAWHEFQPPQQPFTFVVIISTQYLLSIEQLLQVQTAIDATKSARDNYSISAKVKTDCDFNVTGSITTGTFVRLSSYIDQDSYYWQLDTKVNINQGIATYTAMSSDGFDDYSSFANLDLTEAIVRSLHDSDMQQWQAVIDACIELTDGAEWSWDTSNARIIYTATVCNADICDPVTEEYEYTDYVDGKVFNTMWETCEYALTRLPIGAGVTSISKAFMIDSYRVSCDFKTSIYPSGTNTQVGFRRARTKPVPEQQNSDVYFSQIAQKILSNTSSLNEGISLFAEAYIETVANSIFATNESKQFVRMADLIEKFEQNKIILN